MTELQQYLAAFGVLEVEGHAALVGVNVLEVEVVADARPVVVRLQRLDFDDLRTHLAQLADARRTGTSATQVDDSDVRQGAIGHRRCGGLRHRSALRYQ